MWMSKKWNGLLDEAGLVQYLAAVLIFVSMRND